MGKKPSVDEIIGAVSKGDTIYGGIYNKWREDNRHYELNFKSDLFIPVEFKNDTVVTPTARDTIDISVDHTDIANARIFVNKHGTSDTAKEKAEMLRKFALGLIHRTNVESSIAPGRVGAKHFWEYGLAVIKSVWDADNWVEKPEQGVSESEKDYASRMDAWRASHHLSLPIVIKAINPLCIIPDPYTGGQLYVIERQTRLVYDVKRVWKNWSNTGNLADNSEVEFISYWDKDYRCDLINKEPVLKIQGGVVKHRYGFIPYTMIESGLGDVDEKNDPVKRYVGLLRYMYDILHSESTNYTLCDILMKRETMKGGYVTGADATGLGVVKQEYGKYWPVGAKDVQFHDWETKLAPAEAYAHLALTRDYISSHGTPRSLGGMGEQGVRSGADRRLVIAEASSKFNYAKEALANGWANVLSKCAMLVKNVIPGDFEIWARTPTDEFDVVVKKAQFQEPFNFYVEFSPISEEDEYRRHDDLMRRKQAGLIDDEYAWTHQNDVDPEAMRVRMKKQQLRMLPAYNQVQDQMLAQMFQQAASEAGVPIGTPSAPPQMNAGQEPMNTEAMGRRNVPPIPNRAPLGSGEDLQNKMKQTRSQTPMTSTQGQGGGGNRG